MKAEILKVKSRVFKRLSAPCTVAFILMVCASIYSASEQGTLDYTVRADLPEIVYCRRLFFEPREDFGIRPLKEPAYGSLNPVYFEIELARNYFFLVLDESQGTGKGYDTLYFDTNGNKDLTDDEKVTYRNQKDGRRTFGPIKALIGRGKKQRRYHFGLEVDIDDECQMHYHLRSNCCYEGKVKVGPVTRKVMVVDNNVNGFFNDKYFMLRSPGRDVLLIDINNNGTFETRSGFPREAFPYTDYIHVDGKYYVPEIARDGRRLKFTEIEPPPMGTFKTNRKEFSITLERENDGGIFNLAGRDFTAPLPAGEFEIEAVYFKKEDAAGNVWEMDGSARYSTEKELIVIKQGEVTQCIFGPPFTVELSYRKREEKNGYSFWVNMTGGGKEVYSIRKNGKEISPPDVKITSADGAYRAMAEHRCLGCGRTDHGLTWMIPADRKGKFIFTPILDSGPFKGAKGPPQEIEIK